jgi:hypothetical protein
MKIKDTLPDDWSPVQGDDGQPIAHEYPSDVDHYMVDLMTILDRLETRPNDLYGYRLELGEAIDRLSDLKAEVELPF